MWVSRTGLLLEVPGEHPFPLLTLTSIPVTTPPSLVLTPSSTLSLVKTLMITWVYPDNPGNLPSEDP